VSDPTHPRSVLCTAVGLQVTAPLRDKVRLTYSLSNVIIPSVLEHVNVEKF